MTESHKKMFLLLAMMTCLIAVLSTAIVKRGAGMWGYIDKTGKMIIKPHFESAREFSEGLAAVMVERKWGFIDKSGKMVIKPQFLKGRGESLEFSEGLAAVSILGQGEGFIDKAGKLVIKPVLAEAGNFHEGLARVRFDENDVKFGFIDKAGKPVIAPQFIGAGDFSEGLAPVEDHSGHYGFIDKAGKTIINPQFIFASSFHDGLASATLGSKISETGQADRFIDKTGNFVIKREFDFANSFSEGFSVARVDGKDGYIDKTGKLVFAVNANFGRVKLVGFSDGLSLVEISLRDQGFRERYGYIDRTGKMVINPNFEEAGSFQDGLAPVSTAAPSFIDDLFWLFNRVDVRRE